LRGRQRAAFARARGAGRGAAAAKWEAARREPEAHATCRLAGAGLDESA